MSDLLPMKRPEVFQGIPDKIDLTLLEAALSAVKNPKTGRPFYTGRVGRLRFTEEHRAAIRAFQKSINEPETGLFKRNSVTHRKLSEAARRALRNLPKQPRARLTFDGAALLEGGVRCPWLSKKGISICGRQRAHSGRQIYPFNPPEICSASDFRRNDLQGRSGFSIHGGTSPGSAGCIDLRSGGFLVDLTVKYP